MEVTFGVQARDGALRVELADEQVTALRKDLEEALSGDAGSRIVWVTDKDGREFGIPSDKIAFVEFGAKRENRQVGFAS